MSHKSKMMRNRKNKSIWGVSRSRANRLTRWSNKTNARVGVHSRYI